MALAQSTKTQLRIDICSILEDTRAKVLCKKINHLGLDNTVESLLLIDSYTIDTVIDFNKIQRASQKLINSNKESLLDLTKLSGFNYAIEVGFLPGVTDNVATTVRETFLDSIDSNEELNVYSSQVFLIKANMSDMDLKKIQSSLYNPLIQRVRVKSFADFLQDGGMGIEIPKVRLDKQIKIDSIDLSVSDQELELIARFGIENEDGSRRGPLALGLDYMKTIQKYFAKLERSPTDLELESIAQTWSEHCKHTIFADPIDEIAGGLYKAHIKASTNEIRKAKGDKDFCVSVFTDNSGAIEFDDDYLITHKVETHNSPSALDPFGGAITGIVGVNRDAIACGMGAKPIANIYGFCFADPDDTELLYRDKDLTQPMLSPKRIMDGVIDGVRVGGNCSGIPTVHGFTYFNDRYKGKPLVFVGTIGLLPKTIKGKPAWTKQAKPGDYIVVLGGRVGLDGIHGATFSSVEMDAESPASAVQIGDPITQKKFSDAIIKEARDRELYNSITDNGAGGISCSVAEMARESGGCFVELDKVPLKYPGMQPWQIWISESQERMTLAIPPEKWEEFNSLMLARDVEATVIGKFTDSGRCIVQYGEQIAMDIELEFLHNGLPKRQLRTNKPSAEYFKQFQGSSNLQIKNDLSQALLNKLQELNHSSTEFISQRYDHEVQASSVIKPLQGKGRVNGDIAVIRPRLDSRKAAILSYGLFPEYSEPKPGEEYNKEAYNMSANSIDQAIRLAVAAGADPERIAILDNFCWCSSEEPERLFQLKEATQACYDFAKAYGTPFISGKDSMFNDFKGYDAKANPVKISALPTLLISALSVIDDYRKVLSMDFKFAGDLIYLLGSYSSSVEAEKNKILYSKLAKTIDQGLVASSISVSRGGLGIALARKAISAKLGFEVEIDTSKLFTESSGLILVSVNPDLQKQFESILGDSEYKLIGNVSDKQEIIIKDTRGIASVQVDINKAIEAYRSRFGGFV